MVGDGERSPAREPLKTAWPYLSWAIDNESAFLPDEKWLPLLVEFAPGKSLKDFLRSVGESRSSIRIPLPFRVKFLPPTCRFGVFFIELGKADSFRKSSVWNESIVRADIGPPVALLPPTADELDCDFFDDGVEPPCLPPQPGAKADIQRVVTVVIDEGIAFAHPRFRRRWTEDGITRERTRIEFVWVQDTSGHIVPGREFTGSEIDAALGAVTNAGQSEERVYANLGVLDMKVEGYKPLAHKQAHGTHVLDMASGYDPEKAPASRPIIAVEMPEASVGDPAGSTLKPHAICGLVYALWRAHGLRHAGEILPVVANISYGPHEGPHDGSSAFEAFLDYLTYFSQLVSVPLLPVLSAGNYRQSRAHANFQLTRNQVHKLQWRLQPCGLTSSFMEIYFPSGSQVTLTLRSPLGTTLNISTTDVPNTQIPGGTKQPFAGEYVVEGVALDKFMLALARTARDPWVEDDFPVVPAGIWTVEIAVESLTPVNFDAWIKRSDTPSGRRAKGRQSYFDDAGYQRFEGNTRPTEFDPVGTASYVKRENTLSGIATGREAHVIGGYRRGPDRTDLMPTIYTSQASGTPVPGRAILGVNWLAPADDGITCRGTLGAGTRSGGRLAMNGTSVAAPQAVRYCVETWATTGIRPGAIPPISRLDQVSQRVPANDSWLVAGVGLMRLKPPEGHRWNDRQYAE